MPISAEKMKLYPGGSTASKEWQALRNTVRRRAKDRCEGSPAYPDCRVRNGSRVIRLGPNGVEKSVRIVCTTAHLEEGNHDPEMLRFWCQRCHNTYDAPMRRKNAARTLHAKKNGGQEFDL